ncbi:MAG: multiheme c-type cytochrome, partial [Shewanella sp.]
GKVMYPQTPAADCAACHVEGEGAPANAGLFKADLSSAACIGCHTEKPSSSHSDSNCVACHNATNTYNGTGNAAKRHGDVLKAFDLAKGMSVKFSNTVVNASNQLTFDVQVMGSDNTPIAPEFLDPKAIVTMAWDSNKDFPAYTEAPFSNRRMSLSEASYNAATQTYSFTASKVALPANADTKTFELWSDLKVCFNNGGYGVADIKLTACTTDGVRKVDIKEPAYHFVLNPAGTTKVTMRRAIIDEAKCQSCHNQVVFHYDNGINCQTCHTSDKTTKIDNNYPGGKKSTSFAYKAHLASGHYLKYAGVQSGTVLKTDCATCHSIDSKSGDMVGIQLGRAPERVWRYGDTSTGADIWVSSDAGACLSCHQKYLSDSGKSHIESFGGVLNGTDAADVNNRASESCSTCHTPEQVLKLHGN